ncbi:4-diphosphocytidyl-2-C-methyl-D-erythritol kinase [Pseudoxanthomonas sp. GM95]|uniref:4-(cytidine 5'-diphospho)-2-C-methyl-D-erythritol kinase n=1 Tax=Pseudoxanthomonas sp. GM95 TaxID=1881043 RepID=UPI0008B2B22B|nr:4-(cytidine 5'-diphospho)-2-C-methyl-D-erythritol kinase [Pseudoxanthomonas sp. GM95]SEK61160.1 4-diphosphocytidyl-2-C-methyl-D-erythritol kinase [Pseudoxanthomonas sp. GM95]
MNASHVPGGWSWWPAPAKLNLCLRITGRRADGYHDLQSAFRILDWGDRVGIRLREDGRVARVGASAPGVAEADDLLVRAALLLQKHVNGTSGADICVEKNIPAGGGFGGGSSDAATVLRVLDQLWATDLGEDVLAGLGLQLGADVPVFVRGRNAWAEGVGEQLTPLDLPQAWYVLVDPGIHVATAKLFGAPDLTRTAAPVKISDFLSGSVPDNVFEPVLRRREPAIEAVFATLSRIGTPRLTGTGSGCFVEFASLQAAQAGSALLPADLRGWVVAGAARSPLLDALEGNLQDIN